MLVGCSWAKYDGTEAAITVDDEGLVADILLHGHLLAGGQVQIGAVTQEALAEGGVRHIVAHGSLIIYQSPALHRTMEFLI